jgi:radical SAM protein with 4Fe4S-binding SPASM domain
MNRKLCDVTLEITKKCPLNCIFCSSFGGASHNDELNINEWKKLVNEATELGANDFLISGGEPFTSPFLKELCEFILTKKANLSIYSSGNIYHNGKLNALNKEKLLFLKNQRSVKIIFSLLGSTNKIHDGITKVTGSYKNVLKSIKIANDSGLHTEIHFVPIKDNFKDLSNVVKLATNLGIEKVSILRYVAQGRGAECNLDLDKNELLELRKIFLELKKYGEYVRIGAPFNPFLLEKHYACTAGYRRITIRYDGLAVPCEAMKFLADEGQDDINVRKFSLKYIWNESLLFKLARKLHDLTIGSECLSCEYLALCGGGCPAQKLLNEQDNNYDPYCSIKLMQDEKCLLDHQKEELVHD